MIIWNAVQSVLTILLMVALGYLLTRKGWLTDNSAKLFSTLVVKVALPAFMISNLLSTFDKQKLSTSGLGFLIPIASMGLGYSLSILLSYLLKVDHKRRGVFRVLFSLSNTIFIGLPVNIALFGDQSVPYVLMYYIGNTLFFWTAGVYGIRKDGGAIKNKMFSMDTFKNILTPPLIAFVFTITMIQFQIPLPKFFLDSCKYIGNLTTPLSMLFIGIIIHSLNFKEITIDKEMIVILMGRFIIAPLLMVSLFYFFPLPVLMKKVFILEAAMPVMTQAAIVAKAYGGDDKYATIMATVSTFLSLFFIPLYMFLFTILG